MDILKTNIRVVLPRILHSIDKAAFVAIDAELTGLHANREQRPSLFNDGEERYCQIKEACSKFYMWQLGISTFKKSPAENSYVAEVFNIYLMPQNIGSLDPTFTCQAGAISFLCNWKFDFNKVFYNGLSFLSRTDEKALKGTLRNNQNLFESSDMPGYAYLTKVATRVREYLLQDDDKPLLIDIDEEVNVAFLQYELYRRFPNIVLEANPGTLTVSQIQSGSNDQQRKRAGEDKIKHQLLEEYLGASIIVKKLLDVAKQGTPVVGHNPIYDLAYIYKQFCDNLPNSLRVFKSQLSSEIPVVFDTKQVAIFLRSRFKEDKKILDILDSSVLSELYENLMSESGRSLVCFTPKVVLGETAKKYESQEFPHEAGFDAFMTGVCFLKMAHLYGCKEIWKDSKQLTASEHLSALKSFANCIYLGRCKLPYINLAGRDPESLRPAWLYVRARRGQRISLPEIVEYARRFGSSDVRVLGNNRALLAFASVRSADDLLADAVKSSLAWEIRTYNPFLHSRIIQNIAIAGGMLFTGGIVMAAFLLVRNS